MNQEVLETTPDILQSVISLLETNQQKAAIYALIILKIRLEQAQKH